METLFASWDDFLAAAEVVQYALARVARQVHRAVAIADRQFEGRSWAGGFPAGPTGLAGEAIV